MGTPLRLLLIEDSEDDAQLIVHELRRGGYDLTFERVDTCQAMSAALENQEWDVVIADYSIPRFGGLDALGVLRESGHDLPFIIVSGAIGQDTAVAAMKAGAHDCVLKHNLARLLPAVDRELQEVQSRRARGRAEQLWQALNQAALAMERALGPEDIFAAVSGELAKLGFDCRVLPPDETGPPSSTRYSSLDDTAGYRPAIAAPLIAGDEVIGVLSVQSEDLSAEDVPAITAFAHQVAATWRKAQLLEQAQQELGERKRAEEALRQQTAQLEALQQVSLELTAQLDLDTLLNFIVARAIELLEGVSGGLYLYRPEHDLLEWSIGIGPDLPALGSMLAPGEGVSGRVWDSGEPLIVNDYYSWEGRSAVFDGLVNVASVAALVRWGDQSLGVLNVLAGVPHTFTPADAELLSTFATQAAIAVRNARLYEAASRRAERLDMVNHIARGVGATLDLDDLLEIVCQEITAIFQADAFFVALYDDVAQELDFRLQVDRGVRQPPERQSIDTGLTSLVVTQNRPLLIRDFEREQECLPKPALWGTMQVPASWLGVPMQVGERLVGIVCVQAYRSHAYGSEEQSLLSTIADQVAVALENARLYQTLHDSEERYRTLVDQANDAVFVQTREGKILDANARACKLLDYEREELLRLTMKEIVPPEALEVLQQLGPGNPATGELRLETENLRKDGSRVPVEISATVFEVGGQAVVMVLIRDITERKRAARLLQALNEAALAVEQSLTQQDLFRTMAKELRKLDFDCAILVVDEQQDNLLPRYFSYDLKAVKTAERLLGMDATSFTMPVDQVDAFRQVIREGQTVFVDGIEAIEQVLPRPLNKGAQQVVRLLKVGKTIDAPLKVKDEIIGVLSVQSDDLTVDDIPAVTAFAYQMAAAWRKTQLMQDLESSLAELNRTQSQLFQAQKMEALGRLAGGIAHDFNNLLTVIDISTRLLERQMRSEDPLWDHVQRIREASERAAKLTRQLLSFSRREIVEPRVVVLNDLLGDLGRMLQRVIGEDIRLATNLAPNLWPVKVDPSQVEQVIVNLAVNARDAMPQGGSLTIETSNVVLDTVYVAQNVDAQPGKHVLLTISDTGVGMDDEVKEHLFEPFFTTKGRGRGTGLGLPIVFGIVRQCGGHIRVESQLGQGTVFSIYIPSTKEAESRLPLLRMPDGAVRGTETVLVVEDEPAVRQLAVNILTSYGYRVLAAENGEEALSRSNGHNGRIHLLVTDVVMPAMSGTELAERLRSRRGQLRVLYMSGYSSDVMAQRGVLEEGMVVLSKPFTLEALATQVRAVLDAPG